MSQKHILLDNYFGVAKIASTKGFRGEMKLVFFTKDYSFKKNEFIFISRQGLPVPYKVEYLSKTADPLLKLIGVDSMEESKKFIGSEILVERLDTVQEGEQEVDDWNAFIGLSIRCNEKVIGKIIRVEEFPSQTMATIIDSDDTEKYVPLIDEWIKEVNMNLMYIEMNLPDGLL